MKMYEAGGSPAYALLYDAGSKGFCVNHLIRWLDVNRHERALTPIRAPGDLKVYCFNFSNGVLTELEE